MKSIKHLEMKFGKEDKDIEKYVSTLNLVISNNCYLNLIVVQATIKKKPNQESLKKMNNYLTFS